MGLQRTTTPAGRPAPYGTPPVGQGLLISGLEAQAFQRIPVDTQEIVRQNRRCARERQSSVHPRRAKKCQGFQVSHREFPMENLVHNLVHTTVANHHTQLESRHK